MKTVILFCLTVLCLSAYSPKKDLSIENQFEETLKIVKSDSFNIRFTIATPLNDLNIDIDSAYLRIHQDSATGYLPYYTAHYAFPQTGRKGVVFDNTLINPKIKIKGRNAQRYILYQFAVIGKNDNYKIKLNIQYDRTCYLFVTSLRRAPISYVGSLQ